MRNLTILLTLWISIGNAQPSKLVAGSNNLVLEGGTMISLRLLSQISSKTADEGDLITFSVVEDVTVGKSVLIKEGSIVNGTVEKVEKAKGLGKGGELTYSLQYVKAIDGSKVYLGTTKSSMQGESKTGGAVALAVVVTPFFLLKKGKNVTMESGKLVQAYVDRDYTIDVSVR